MIYVQRDRQMDKYIDKQNKDKQIISRQKDNYEDKKQMDGIDGIDGYLDRRINKG